MVFAAAADARRDRVGAASVSERRSAQPPPAYVVLPAATATAFTVAALCGPPPATLAEALVGAVVAAGACVASSRVAATLAVLAWSILTGLAVNGDGRLTASAADGRRLALLVGIALAARAAGGGWRGWRAHVDARPAGRWAVYPQSPDIPAPRIPRPTPGPPTQPPLRDREPPHA
jgi:hypothetical protein